MLQNAVDPVHTCGLILAPCISWKCKNRIEWIFWIMIWVSIVNILLWMDRWAKTEQKVVASRLLELMTNCAGLYRYQRRHVAKRLDEWFLSRIEQQVGASGTLKTNKMLVTIRTFRSLDIDISIKWRKNASKKLLNLFWLTKTESKCVEKTFRLHTDYPVVQ